MDAETYNPGKTIARLDILERNGSIGKLLELMRDNSDVYIKRTSGAWQKAKILPTADTLLLVTVIWSDETGRELEKKVTLEDLLKWQDEFKIETEG